MYQSPNIGRRDLSPSFADVEAATAEPWRPVRREGDSPLAPYARVAAALHRVSILGSMERLGGASDLAEPQRLAYVQEGVLPPLPGDNQALCALALDQLREAVASGNI